jgi:ABC-2 type transport system permease protein
MNSMYIAINMLKRTIGQKKGLILFIVIPAFVVSIMIGIVGQTPSRIVTVAYINQDQGVLGHHILTQLSSHKDYNLIEAADTEALKEMVIKQNADAAFLIPFNFSDTLYKSSSDAVEMYQVRVNEATYTLKINLNSIIGQLKQVIATQQAASVEGSELQASVALTIAQMEKHQIHAAITDNNLYVNPSLNTIIGFMLMFMMGLVSNTVVIIMDDRRQMTMTRMYTAPVRAFEIAFGNFLGSFLVGTLQVVFILLFTKYVMQFDYHLPFWPHFIVLEFFLLTTMGIASAMAGMMKNSTSVGTLNTLIVTPTCMLGGCFWPISIMPEWMQKLANFVPQKWAIEAIQMMASGHSLTDVGLQIGILALFALILLGIGSVILQPSEGEMG